MSSLGLTRTGRAPFLSLLNPSYMMSAACCCPTCPRLSFPSRNELPITSDDAGGIPSSASPPANDTVLKERRQIQPSQPHPDPPLTAGQTPIHVATVSGAGAGMVPVAVPEAFPVNARVTT